MSLDIGRLEQLPRVGCETGRITVGVGKLCEISHQVGISRSSVCPDVYSPYMLKRLGD